MSDRGVPGVENTVDGLGPSRLGVSPKPETVSPPATEPLSSAVPAGEPVPLVEIPVETSENERPDTKNIAEKAAGDALLPTENPEPVLPAKVDSLSGGKQADLTRQEPHELEAGLVDRANPDTPPAPGTVPEVVTAPRDEGRGEKLSAPEKTDRELILSPEDQVDIGKIKALIGDMATIARQVIEITERLEGLRKSGNHVTNPEVPDATETQELK